MTDHAKAATHYSGLVAEANTCRRLTIEVYALDPGIDLAACTFSIASHLREPIAASKARHVKAFVPVSSGKVERTVGLWRIVPDA